MKKFILALIFALIIAYPASAQEPVKTYLPIIVKGDTMPAKPGPLKKYPMTASYTMIVPTFTGRKNYVLNPSGEGAGNYSAVGGATVIGQDKSSPYFGISNYYISTSGNGQGIQLDISLPNTINGVTPFYISAHIANAPKHVNFVFAGKTKPAQLLRKLHTTVYGDAWGWYGAKINPDEFIAYVNSFGSPTDVKILQSGKENTGIWYVDGVVVEGLNLQTYQYYRSYGELDFSTYFDGDQEDCVWNGLPHESTSSRANDTRSGGREVDFFEEFGFFLKKVIGAGAVTQTITIDNYAQIPGGEQNGDKIEVREFTLVGDFYADSEEELNANVQKLYDAMQSDTVVGKQPFRLRYYGSKIPKEIKAKYKAGLEGDMPVYHFKDLEPGDDTWIKIAKFKATASIQLVAEDPFWYELGQSSYEISDVQAAFNVAYLVGRVPANATDPAVWDNFGPASVAGGGVIYAILEDDTYIYFGGAFANWDGIAAADHLARFNKNDRTFSSLGTPGLNGFVRALAKAPNGDIIIGGDFEDADGQADGDYVIAWDVVNETYYTLGSPGGTLTGFAGPEPVGVRTLAFDRNGLLVIGGNFYDWAGIADADMLVSYDFASDTYDDIGGGGLDFWVNDIAVGPDNTYYIVGAFQSPYFWVMKFDGTNFVDLNLGGFTQVARAVALHPTTHALYVAGASTGWVMQFDGAAWTPVGGGISLTGGTPLVWDIAFGPDATLYASGSFDTAGGVRVENMAQYNGHTWRSLDISVPGLTAFVIVPSQFVDSENRYGVLLGLNGLTTAYQFISYAITNEGNANAYPLISITRVDDAVSYSTLRSIRNERTNKQLLSNYSLLYGEEVRINLDPKKRTVTSSMFGNILYAIYPNSDMGQWYLPPGESNITIYIADDGSGSASYVYLLWKDRYRGNN